MRKSGSNSTLVTPLQRQFSQDGYVVFPGVVSPQEIASMREAGEKFFSKGRSHMFTRDFLEFPALASLPFNPKIVEKIRAVFGEQFATISQFSMSANLHNPQWHRDSQSQTGDDCLFDPEYLVAKCAVYLQDNDREWGGGMEIVPRSHRAEYFGYRSSFSRSNPIGKLVRLLQRVALNLRTRRLRRVWLPLKAGDALLFHANLVHRASQPARGKKYTGHMNVALVDPPKDKFKFLIDWEVSPSNRYLPTYLAHQKKRALSEAGLFRDSLGVRFPEDYDPKLVEHIQRLGLKIAQYSEVSDAEEGAKA